MKIFKLVLVLTTLVLIIQSCKKFDKDVFDGAWNPDLAFPLAYSSFGVKDVLAKNDSSELIISNPTTGAISLVYSKVLKSLTAQELYGDISFNEDYQYNIADLNLTPSANFDGTINSIRTEILQFQTQNGEELHHMNFKSGFFNFHFETQLKQNVFLTITYPRLLNGSTPITQDIELIYTGGNTTVLDVPLDLTNLNGDFTIDGTQFNALELEIQIQVVGNGQNDIVGNELFNVNLTSQDMVFKNMDGYFGQNSLVNDQDSILIRIFQNTDTAGHFEFSNPQVEFNIVNSFGIPIDLHLNNLKTIQAFEGGQTFPLNGFPSPITVNTPTNPGQTASTSLILNEDNTTNLNTIISPTPKYFYFEANALPNPLGNTGVLNFVDENSNFEISADVNLPLEGYMYGFYVQDTFDFSFNQKTENIESLLFRLISDNGFPVDVSPVIKFVDKNYKVLFNLFNIGDKIIDGAPVDANGKVTSSLSKINDISLTKGDLESLKDVKYIIIRAETNSTGYNPSNPSGSQIVKFYDFYKLDFQLSMDLKFKKNN
ncbi:MAG: hypothetical protein HYU67_01875 [Flavobacteriia bacterium]|nr:hypothetical protein [Flavobacteriia bacterium]